MSDYELYPDPPYAVVIDLVEGCNLYCDFCGLQGVRTKKEKNYKFMDLDTLSEVCHQIQDAGWKSRIEVGSHGEPTMHPDLYEAIDIIRTTIPDASIMLTTNGAGFVKDTVPRLNRIFDLGVNCIGLDEYEYVNIYKKIRDNLFEDIDDADFDVGCYPDDKSLSPNKKWSHKVRQLVLVTDISKAKSGTKSNLTNHCGLAAPLTQAKAGKRCSKPFREVTVRWDGNVAGCCNDWLGMYQCGNVLDTSVHEIWEGREFRTLRRFLYRGIREMAPCFGCNNTGYRLGFLPDRKGLKDLDPPTKSDYSRWKTLLKNEPLTPPIIK